MARNVAAGAAVALSVGVAGLWRLHWRGDENAAIARPPADEAIPPEASPQVTSGQAPVSAEIARPAYPAAAAAALTPADASPQEGALMGRLRMIKNSDPALAVTLGRQGNRLFPASADAPERASIVIHALASEGLASEARGEAEDMVNRYPDSSWVREIEQFTGAHRHRSYRLSPDGALESY